MQRVTTPTVTRSADLKLAQRLQQGDRASFDVFFKTYYPRLYRFALARLDGDADLADETAQVVLCQALSKMATYRGEAALFTWLCTFCRYELSKQRKARARAQGDRPLVEDDPVVRSALDSLLSESARDPDVEVYKGELARLVTVTLDELPSLYADALESKYVHDCSVREIAERIGKSEKATESVLTRAREAFRDCFNTLVAEERAQPDGMSGAAAMLEY
ncbi:MAG: RNA polymerase sigma factor [Woeseiaceae bacterium]|nr:RNA polymerase sigma factor [Woeseiaceae bacterium]